MAFRLRGITLRICCLLSGGYTLQPEELGCVSFSDVFVHHCQLLISTDLLVSKELHTQIELIGFSIVNLVLRSSTGYYNT